MVALYFAFYNFCRIHRPLRCTPAMAAGVTGDIWDLRDLVCNSYQGRSDWQINEDVLL